MLVGYARVSTPDQNLALQCDALQQAGCDRLFTDVASGVQTDPPRVSRDVVITQAARNSALMPTPTG